MDAEEARDIASKQCKPNTANETQLAILLFLSQRHKNGRLVKGATEEAMQKFPLFIVFADTPMEVKDMVQVLFVILVDQKLVEKITR